MWRRGDGEEIIYIYLSLHCHHQNDSCIKIGSDESHFNCFINCEGQSHKDSVHFEEKGEPKQIRTEVPLLQYQPNPLNARPR